MYCMQLCIVMGVYLFLCLASDCESVALFSILCCFASVNRGIVLKVLFLFHFLEFCVA